MFSQALDKISQYTMPVIISKRLQSGKIESGCATFIILNAEGWILTAGHVLEELALFHKQIAERQEYSQKIQEIENNTKLSRQQKSSKIRSIPVNQQWITHISYWWGRDGLSIQNFTIDGVRDLAVGQLESFAGNEVSVYPIFKNASTEYMPGTSICRMGFPFHNIDASFVENTGGFQLAPNTLPMPRFPNDGIITRFRLITEPQLNRTVKFIETSTPGLRGQSGGPIFDVNGHILGIQSHTESLALGFNPKIKEGSREIVVPQFINVGVGTHTEEVLSFLRDNSISVNISD